MLKFHLLNKVSGIGKESGRPWCRITLASDHADGTRSVADFFVTPEVSSKVASIPLDSAVYVSTDLDAQLHYQISDMQVAGSKSS